MRHWIFATLVFIITFALLLFVRIPFLVFLFLIIPLITILFTMFTFLYSFRDSLEPEDLKREVGNIRQEELDRLANAVQAIGFEKLDEFYLRTVPDTTVYAFKLKDKPIYMGLYHMGSKRSCDLVTIYSNSCTLTTCDNVGGGMTPRPESSLLQIFPDKQYDYLLQEHLRAHEFLCKRKFSATEIMGIRFRKFFIRQIKLFARYVRKFSFWPILLLWWAITVRGKRYCSPIKFQYDTGKIKLPE